MGKSLELLIMDRAITNHPTTWLNLLRQWSAGEVLLADLDAKLTDLQGFERNWILNNEIHLVADCAAKDLAKEHDMTSGDAWRRDPLAEEYADEHSESLGVGA